MNRSHALSLGLVAIAPLAILIGCSHQDAAPPPTSVAASQPPAQPVRHRATPRAEPAKAQSDSDEGVLTVGKDVVIACPNLRQVAEAARSEDPQAVWVAILGGLSDCMNEGGLKDRHILVSGDAEHRDVVRLVLLTKGAPMDRVVARAPAACAAPPCATAGRVDIGLLP